jgi:hypothetical protein
MKQEELRRRAMEKATALTEWWTAARQRHSLLDFGGDLFDRDLEARGSVLGSAIALRLFLFVLPATVTMVGLINVFRLGSILQHHLDASVTTGSISKALSNLSFWSALSVVVSGTVLMLLAGRSLAKVLGACAGAAWGLSVRESKVTMPAVLALTGVLFSSIVAGSMFSRLREIGGLPATLTAWLAVMGSTALAWFIVMLSLPRKVSDPGALLPGTLLMGVAYTVLQWFMQYYLPNRVARTSDTFGDLAITVATLGNFFFIGRIMASSFVVSAVTYERWGSVSQVLFDLPGVRKVARRSTKLQRYFSLTVTPSGLSSVEVSPSSEEEPPAASASSPTDSPSDR